MTIEIECAECGSKLDAEWYQARSYDDPTLRIPVCDVCKDKSDAAAKEEGDKEGYDRGYAEGEESGRREAANG